MSFVFLSIVFFLAGFVVQLTGFGVSTIMMVLLPFVFPLHVVIPLVALVSFIATSTVAITTKSTNIGDKLIMLLTGSVLGVPMGMLLLNESHEPVLRVMMGGFFVVYSLFGLFVHKPLVSNSSIGNIVIGILGGFFGAVFNINGPLVGIYKSGDLKLSKVQLKDLVATYMSYVGFGVIVGHWYFGRITQEVFVNFFLSLPFLMLGLYFGLRFFKRVEDIKFRKFIYTMTFLAGALILMQ